MRLRVSWRAAASALFVGFVCTPVAAADSVTVNAAADLAPALGECSGGGSCSLRQALDAAHNGDTIVVPALGGTATTYTLSSGPLTVTKSVTIAGDGAGLVEVSGDDASTVFTVTAGPTTVSGLTISHGAGGDATSDGGGITATADLTLRDDVFADDAGGSGAYDGAPEAGGAGGVQSNAGTLTVRDSTFHDDAGGDGAIGPDDADQQGGNGGPGAIAARLASVVNVTVTASTGGDGGAGSDGTDEDDVGEPFTPPGYGGHGGAGAISGPIVLTGGVVVQSSTLAGNFAGEGGAPGGGGDNDDGGPTLPGDPGGSAVVGVLLQTSIAISSQSVRTTCVFTRDGGHNLTFPSGNDCPGAVFADPLLAGLAANGGATPTLAIAANSPAIDAAPTSACPATDQRGVARPQGSACDIGAFEHDPVTHGGGGTDPSGGPDPGGGSNPGGGSDPGADPQTPGGSSPDGTSTPGGGTPPMSGGPPGAGNPPGGPKGPLTKPRVLLSTLAPCRRSGTLPSLALQLPRSGTVTATLGRVSSSAHHGCPSIAPSHHSGRRVARVTRRLAGGRVRLSLGGYRRLTPGGYELTLRGPGWSVTLTFWVLKPR